MWCKNNCDRNPIKFRYNAATSAISDENCVFFRKKMGSFLDYIRFKYIPCDVLVKEVYPLKIVPNFTMIRALAHQVSMTHKRHI